MQISLTSLTIDRVSLCILGGSGDEPCIRYGKKATMLEGGVLDDRFRTAVPKWMIGKIVKWFNILNNSIYSLMFFFAINWNLLALTAKAQSFHCDTYNQVQFHAATRTLAYPYHTQFVFVFLNETCTRIPDSSKRIWKYYPIITFYPDSWYFFET